MRDRFFTSGPGPFADRLRGEGVDLMVGAHFDLLDSSLDDLVKAGFRPTPVTIDALQKSFAESLSRLANEAAAWITQSGSEPAGIEECAADVICALAVLYELRPLGGAVTGDELARFAMASQMVGTQEMMLIFARMGHFDEVAQAQINHEAAQEAGRQGARLRASEADKWRDRARLDWAAYKGALSKSAWAKRNASNYTRQWRVVFAAISDAGGE
jgi:hypothetical protein